MLSAKADPKKLIGAYHKHIEGKYRCMPAWHLYIIRTRHGALYTGITTDVARRVAEHKEAGRKAARYLRSKGPLQLAYSAKIGSRSLALKAEDCIKKLPKRKKEAIIAEKLTTRALLELISIQAP